LDLLVIKISTIFYKIVVHVYMCGGDFLSQVIGLSILTTSEK